MKSGRKWLRRAGMTLITLIIAAFVGLFLIQKFSDGPNGPLSGGTFRTGEEAALPVDDWRLLEGDFEFELVGTGSSRTAGGIVVDEVLYITCDLGFIWNRLPEGSARNVLNVIWWFKTWHEDAQEDGRIRIRKDGKIYAANLQLVSDLDKIERLKLALEALAAEFFEPNGLGPRPQQSPNEILFFRVLPMDAL